MISGEDFAQLGTTAEERQIKAKKIINERLGYNFFPRRKIFLEFLKKYALEDSDTFDRLFNIKYRADDLFRNFNHETSSIKCARFKDGRPEAALAALNECGHLLDYACYIDNNKCAICDRNQIMESL